MTRLAMRVPANVSSRLARYLAVFGFGVAALLFSTGYPLGLVQAIGETSIATSDGKAEAKVRAALHEMTTMDFSETPLQDAVDYLKDLHGIEIQLDTKALEAEGVGSDTPVTHGIKGIALGSALKLLLSPIELTAIVKDDILLITTVRAAHEKIELRVYDVAHLVANEDDAVDDLASALESVLKPAVSDAHSTGGVGGAAQQTVVVVTSATIKIVPYRKLLLVRAPTAIQDELTRLLAEIRDKSRLTK